jgi:hypothetical protein
VRFLFGVLIGYSLRGKQKPLIIGLAAVAFVLYILLTCVALPAVALLALHLDVQRERQSRLTQTRVPTIKGLSYKEAETKLHAVNLNIRLLATRYDLPTQPGLIIDQTPAPGEEVVTVIPLALPLLSQLEVAGVYKFLGKQLLNKLSTDTMSEATNSLRPKTKSRNIM